MGMFDNYESIANDYIPNNLCPNNDCYPKPEQPCPNLESGRPKKPYEEYDIKGNLTGYWWYYGDTIDLTFNINGEITFENDNIYVTAKDFIEQLKPNIIIRLYNFRREIIYTYNIDLKKEPKEDIDRLTIQDYTVNLPINKELSKQLVKGIYYCSLSLETTKPEYSQTILQMDDCVLNVK